MSESNTPEQNGKPASATPPKQESLLANLLINIAIPALILAKLSGDDWLGTKWAIVVALAFPLLYGLRDFLQNGKANFFSGLGIVSILLTGGISLMELDAKYIAMKEAAIPALLGIATVVSLRTRWPLVKTFLYNDKVLDTDKILFPVLGTQLRAGQGDSDQPAGQRGVQCRTGQDDSPELPGYCRALHDCADSCHGLSVSPHRQADRAEAGRHHGCTPPLTLNKERNHAVRDYQ